MLGPSGSAFRRRNKLTFALHHLYHNHHHGGDGHSAATSFPYWSSITPLFLSCMNALINFSTVYDRPIGRFGCFRYQLFTSGYPPLRESSPTTNDNATLLGKCILLFFFIIMRIKACLC